MTIFNTIKFNAGNDINGNPRRVYVTFRNGSIVATYDEGYRGEQAITNKNHRRAYGGYTFATSLAEYKALCRWPKCNY